MRSNQVFCGLCFPSSCVPHSQFVFIKTPKTWYEAQSYCREKCFDLATINSMTEMKTVLELVKNQNYDAAWIGLWKGGAATWHWSLADEDFYKEGERNYFISTMAPSDVNCGGYYQGKLASYSCGSLRYFLCFDGKKTGADQYIVISQSMGWTTARDYCRTYYTDLASLRNNAENQMIQNVSGQMTVWLGLFRDIWEWSDQTYSSMRYW
ncbi:putative C-type lectin domain family 20 member A, partial [Mastacembelus armatus]|uniref:putative C-type lectin domain family 20 member A n=1 Tax=Mastacembelus armatus TaxID=205130 RepID=UPI000E45DEE9